jgi:hypothetical protein
MMIYIAATSYDHAHAWADRQRIPTGQWRYMGRYMADVRQSLYGLRDPVVIVLDGSVDSRAREWARRAGAVIIEIQS